MTEAVEHIEENITGQLGLKDISRQFHLSEFHFDRLFKVVVGVGLKEYVLGRKLACALERLKASNTSIIDIAMDLGFEYPEVFSRVFKKYFGISPKAYRASKPDVKVVEKASVVMRNFAACNGSIALKASYIHIEPMVLEGLSTDVDVNAPDFRPVLQAASDRVLAKLNGMSHLKHDKFYSVVSCHGDGNGMYTVFSGKESMAGDNRSGLETCNIPSGWYAVFIYEGDMFEIRDTFNDDLYRWIAVKEIALNPNGVGMLAVFDNDYLDQPRVRIMIPVIK
jgi:AraC family transcriptional regulator